MKKIYLLAGVLVAGFAVNAQKAVQPATIKMDRNEIRPVAKKATNQTKAEGDVYWSNGFDTPSEWAHSAGVGHTAGDWAVISTLPSNITGQQAQYGWPATFASATGNFAFIDSDGAGGAASQDAYFTFTQDIDLSSAGSAPMYLVFDEYYRHFLDQNYVEVSNNGGTDWTVFQVNPESEVPVNTNSVAGEVETVNITPALTGGAWSNQVRIRFRYVGQWDWFWGIDNVRIVEAWDNDMKLNSWYMTTPVGTSFGYDYYNIPASQTAFPGVTFGAFATNNGGADQASVQLNATGTGGYDQTGPAIAIDATLTDSLEISTPYLPTGLGTKTVNLTTVITGTDSDLTNNAASFDMFLTQYEFGRDNNVSSGSIGQISSQDAQPLKIGNVMEIFSPMAVTGVKLRLATQAAGAVGNEFFCEIWKFNGTDAYEYVAETEVLTVAGTAAAWVTLPLIGSVDLAPGDDILVVAGHFGGDNEIRFGLAQNTFEGSVLGYTAAGELFQLTSPGAVMIRLLDDPTLGVSELTNDFGMSVYPNPANANTTLSFELSNEAQASVNVTDLAGKVVFTQALGTVNGTQNVTLNTESMTNGVYMVNLTVNGTVSTQKLVVRK